MKLCEKMDKSEKTLPTIEEIDCVGEKEETNLDLTFVNPSSEINCEMCDFVAKNVQGLKFHKKAKHTKNKFNCDLRIFETNNKKLYNDHKASKCKNTQCEKCDFETSIKKFFSDHKASKCLKTILCDFGCNESFKFVEELEEHMQTVHKW